MSMFFQHTDEDGTRVCVHTRADGDLLAEIFPVEDPGLGYAVDLPDVDGRRLLAKLQRYYSLLDGEGLAERTDFNPDELPGRPVETIKTGPML